MSNTLEITYKETVISYDERCNRWTFTLRGRERSAESLAAAKEAIDKPEPKEKPEFKPVQAWHTSTYGMDNPKEVTITSIAESRYSTQSEYWIKTKDGRCKKRGYNLFPKNAGNDALIAELKLLLAEAEKLGKKIQDTKKNLTSIKDPTP